MLDDRNERAGIKFNDRDLIGIPIRITVGKMAGENIVEYSMRNLEEKQELTQIICQNLIDENSEEKLIAVIGLKNLRLNDDLVLLTLLELLSDEDKDVKREAGTAMSLLQQ